MLHNKQKRPPLFHGLRRWVHHLLQPKVEVLMADQLQALEARLRLDTQVQIRELERKASEFQARLISTPSTVAGWQGNVPTEATYVDFENVFRDPQIIKKRHARYVPFFRGKGRIADIGCGRGEFIDLLHREGIPATGVDQSVEMIEHCRRNGLSEVEVADALDYLQGLDGQKLGGIFASHVIEHLPIETIPIFFKYAYQKLVPGGVLVVETVNPHCLVAFQLFWLDPTHVRPLFPEFLEWQALASGFTGVNIQYLTENGFTTSDPGRHGNYAIFAYTARP